MDVIMEVVRSEGFLLGILMFLILLFIGFLILIFKYTKLNKRYKDFMQKLGNGKNLEEDLETYMYRVNKVEQQNNEITNQLETLDQELIKCMKKVGMVRYNAFQDVGSDLSFALALLNEKNDGIVLNGIAGCGRNGLFWPGQPE